MLDAHGGKNDGELGFAPRIFDCRAIWAASSLCGSPLPEKIGAFDPRIQGVHAVDDRDARLDKVARISPCCRVNRFSIDVELMFRTRRRSTVAGCPSPLKTRPSILSETRVYAAHR
jgi:hypothetical protein